MKIKIFTIIIGLIIGASLPISAYSQAEHPDHTHPPGFVHDEEQVVIIVEGMVEEENHGHGSPWGVGIWASVSNSRSFGPLPGLELELERHLPWQVLGGESFGRLSADYHSNKSFVDDEEELHRHIGFHLLGGTTWCRGDFCFSVATGPTLSRELGGGVVDHLEGEDHLEGSGHHADRDHHNGGGHQKGRGHHEDRDHHDDVVELVSVMEEAHGGSGWNLGWTGEAELAYHIADIGIGNLNLTAGTKLRIATIPVETFKLGVSIHGVCFPNPFNCGGQSANR